MAKAIIQQQVDELREDAGKLREDTDFLDAFRKSLIGVPITFVAQKVPDAFMICDGSLILFEDWPEFKEAYDAGKFEGMVLDAEDSAQVGKFVKSGDTGLYIPDTVGLYEQASSKASAGAYLAPGLPNIKGQYGNLVTTTDQSPTGGFINNQTAKVYNFTAGSNQGWVRLGLNASLSSSVYSDSINTVQPPSVQYVRAMYLGKPNTAAA